MMAAVARLQGDPTEELKRRIGFLVEGGKIGASDLNRMLVSETATGPFEADRHVTADVVPHKTAIARLADDKSVNWSEIRRFVRELRDDLVRNAEREGVRERETRPVFYPRVVRARKMGGKVEASPIIFKEDGKVYMVVGSQSRITQGHVRVIEVATGREVMKAEVNQWEVLSPAVFAQDGKTYLMAGPVERYLRVYEASTGREVAKIREPEWDSYSSVTAFEEKGKTYLLMGSLKGNAYVVNPRNGKVMRTVQLGVHALSDAAVFYAPVEGVLRGLLHRGGEKTFAIIGSSVGEVFVFDVWRGKLIGKLAVGSRRCSQPVLFEEGGKTYALMSAMFDGVRVVDPLSGKAVRVIQIGGLAPSEPVVFKKDDVAYAVLGSNDGYLYVAKALTGEVVQKIQTEGVIHATPAVFEENGTWYAVSGSGDGYIYVIEALGGDVVAKIKMGGETRATPTLLKRDGVTYAIVGSTEGNVQVIAPLERGVVGSVKVSGEVLAPAAVFEDGGVFYAAVGAGDGGVYMIQLRGELPEGEKAK